MRKWKNKMSWFYLTISNRWTWCAFVNVLMSNKRCGKVRSKLIFLKGEVFMFFIFWNQGRLTFSVIKIPVRLKKSVTNFCSSWQIGSISLRTSRIVSEKRVLSAADKSIINDPKRKYYNPTHQCSRDVSPFSRNRAAYQNQWMSSMQCARAPCPCWCWARSRTFSLFSSDLVCFSTGFWCFRQFWRRFLLNQRAFWMIQVSNRSSFSVFYFPSLLVPSFGPENHCSGLTFRLFLIFFMTIKYSRDGFRI